MFSDTHCGYDCREYSSFGAEIDLAADSPDGESCARYIEVLSVGSGTLIVETAVGNERTLSATLLVGRGIVCGVRKIKVGTNVGRVLVVW